MFIFYTDIYYAAFKKNDTLTPTQENTQASKKLMSSDKT